MCEVDLGDCVVVVLGYGFEGGVCVSGVVCGIECVV